MSLKGLLEKNNKVHIKIILPFLFLIVLFAVAEILVSNERISRNIEARTVNLLQNHTLLIKEGIKEQEEKVAFYAQFMADITKLSDQLTDTSAGRSVLVYLLDSLKKDRIKIHLYRDSTQDGNRKVLIRRGLLGIRTTSLVETKVGGKPQLSLAAVAPIERSSGISEVIIAEYPLDHQFLSSIRRKTGADITLLYESRLFSSTLSPSLHSPFLVDVLNESLRKDVIDRGKTVIKEIAGKDDPQKIAFSPLSLNFKNQGICAVSLSLREVLINKRMVLLQNIFIMFGILLGAVLLYYIIVRKYTQPILDLSSATRKVAGGNLDVNIDIKTKDELGELGLSFNRMVEQLRQSEDQLKRQMEELAQLYKEVSEERNISKSILDNLTNGVILFDPDQRVVLINPMAEKWLGVKEKQVKSLQIIGVPEDPSLEPLYALGGIQPTDEMVRCWRYFNCDKKRCPAYESQDRRCWFISGTYCRTEIAVGYPEKFEGCKECDVYRAYNSALKQQEIRVEEIELKKPQRRLLKVFHCPIFDDHGRFLGLIKVFNDITAEREIDRLKTEFVSLVSHELRTPLSSIKAYAEILSKKPDRDIDQQVEFLRIINEETDRLTRLINDILNITKIEERRIDLAMRPVDIGRVIEKSVAAHRSSAQRKDIKIVEDVQKEIPEIHGDEDTLMQVLTNLLNNAVKYSPEGREVRVTAQHSQWDSGFNGAVEVSVRDNGVGIPHDDIERIFEKFYRIDRPFIRDQTGTGLGLYFCKYILERHGGRIWAESEEGKGSTFFFTVPVAEKGEMSLDQQHDIQPDSPLPYPKELRERISVMVVGKEKKISRFLRYYLQEEGFKVFEAKGGSEALDMAKNIKPNVILLDTVTQGEDGYKVMEALSENEVTKHISVIVLSESEDPKVAMDLEAVNYLVKPIAREALIKAVNEILSKANRLSK
jgi:signal transduction histidine kinase/CheY-like chemotaxis protein